MKFYQHDWNMKFITVREKKIAKRYSLIAQKRLYYIINITNMINSGYFTSRTEILAWVNTLLATNLNKIEQLGAGNVYCQILDAAFPEKVPLAKVKWGAYL